MDPLSLIASSLLAQSSFSPPGRSAQGVDLAGKYLPGGFPAQGLPPAGYPPTGYPAQSYPTSGSAASGHFLQHSQPIQQLTLVRTIFQGDCPGESVNPVKGISFLASTPPASKQRIVIRNRRTGGYTDREYDGGRSKSERFWISLGTKQHGSFLSVQPGANQFSWRVTRAANAALPKEGAATLYVTTEDRMRYRDFRSINEDAYCPGEKYSSSRTPLSQCNHGYYKVEREGVCPNGTKRMLGTQTIYRRNRTW